MQRNVLGSLADIFFRSATAFKQLDEMDKMLYCSRNLTPEDYCSHLLLCVAKITSWMTPSSENLACACRVSEHHGSRSCQTCPFGFYAAQGNSMCTPCPAFLTSSAGASSLDQCFPESSDAFPDVSTKLKLLKHISPSSTFCQHKLRHTCTSGRRLHTANPGRA